jgi:hypothetical protein
MVRDSWDIRKYAIAGVDCRGGASTADVSIPQGALIFPERETVFQNGMKLRFVSQRYDHLFQRY